MKMLYMCFFFFSSRRRHTRCYRDWSSDVCSSDLRLDHSRPLEDRRHPDAPAVVDLGFEVGKDLVVLVHGVIVQANQLSPGLVSALLPLSALRARGAVGSHAHIPSTR